MNLYDLNILKMKYIYFLILFILVSSNSLKDRIKFVLENEDFLSQIEKVIDSFNSQNLVKIFSTLVDTFSKIKNMTYCLLMPCDTCKDRDGYNKCSNNCWNGFLVNPECLDKCYDNYCN